MTQSPTSPTNGRVPAVAPPDLSGEDVALPIRMVVASEAGVFRRVPTSQGDAFPATVREGEVIGVIERLGDPVLVVSPLSGLLMGLLAATGQRIRPWQPLAWFSEP